MKNMKHRLLSITACLVLAVLMGTLSYITRRPEAPPFKTRPHLPVDLKSTRGTAEHAHARWAFETLRLQDPATGAIPENIRHKELTFAKANLLRKKSAAHQTTWSSMGPYNVGGRTRALGIDMNNADIMLAGGASGGMFRTTDGGESWTNTTDPAMLHSITCLVQDKRPGKQTHWYYGSGEAKGNSATKSGAWFCGNGIYRSLNNGLTWHSLEVTAGDNPQGYVHDLQYIWNLAIDESNTQQDEMYAAVLGKIVRSTDGFQNSFQTVLGYGAYSTDVAITSEGVVYASLSSDGGVSGIWRSEDGSHWTNITPDNWPATVNRTVIAIAPSNENVVYFLSDTPGSGLRNTDPIYACHTSFWKYTYTAGNGSGNGGVWENRSSNLPAYDNRRGTFAHQNSYDLVIKVKPDNENVVFIGGVSLYRSNDGFATNLQTALIGGYTPNGGSYLNHHVDQHAILFPPGNPSTLISGNDGGVHKLLSNMTQENYSRWESLDNGYLTTQFYTVALNPQGEDFFAIGGLQDNGTWATTSTHPDSNWTSMIGGDGGYCAISNDNATYYVSSWGGATYRMRYDGQYWSYAEIEPAGDINFLFLAPYVLDPNNNDVMYFAAGDRIYRNHNLNGIPDVTDGNYAPTSINWTELVNSATPDNAYITALAISDSPGNRLYYGTQTGEVYRIQNARVGDPIPVNLNLAHLANNGYVNCIMVDPQNADHVMVVYCNYNIRSLFYSEDGGDSWTDVSGNLEEMPDGQGNGPSCRWASVLHTDSGPVYFVATSTGLYSTGHLNGQSTIWNQEGETTIGNVVVDMVATRHHDGMTLVATHGKGMFASQVTSTVKTDKPGILPVHFELEQNSPNPFNPETTLAFTLPQKTHVSLKIFDMLGREVAVLADESKSAGRHTLTFNAGHLPSGVYLYRLEAGHYIKTRKMTVAR